MGYGGTILIPRSPHGESDIPRMTKSKKMTCSSHDRDNKHILLMSVGKPERKRPFGRSRCRCEDNIEADFKETVCEGVDQTELSQERLQ
jgi:hypothetical protein